MDCLFCKIIKGEVPSYKIYENDDVYAFLDINPDTVGHTLIIPKKHTLDNFSINEEEILNIFKASKEVGKLLQEKLKCDGITYSQNNGNCQFVKHYHLHVLPKYDKKIELSLEEVYEKITK